MKLLLLVVVAAILLFSYVLYFFTAVYCYCDVLLCNLWLLYKNVPLGIHKVFIVSYLILSLECPRFKSQLDISPKHTSQG